MGGKAEKITPRQRRFADEWPVDLDATAAAKRAGYSENTAAQIGYQLLQKTSVRELIEKNIKKRAEKTGITAERVVRELELLAFSDVSHYVIDNDGRVQPAEGAPEGATRALSSLKRKVTFTKDGERVVETEIRLWNKPDPLKLAGRHTGVKGFSDRIEHTGKDGKPISHRVTGGLTDEAAEEIRQKILGIEPGDG